MNGGAVAPAYWDRLQSLFSGAWDLGPEDRRAYLDQHCGTNQDLRRAVESLLAITQAKGLDEAARQWPASAELRIGQRLGVYRIDRLLGEGGMGAVYLASRADGQFEQQVAIKTVRAGFHTAGLISRFRRERQILARMTHPNIGRLLDGGVSEDGVPYFVMEYVDGLPLIEFADKHSSCERERLTLFLKVLAAVQYLHQNLVIHRDIKPGNILVTAAGEVKLLDFGIARTLTEATPEDGATGIMGRPMTPEYCSPEQAAGLELSTAADVYSLGVVLYELVAGRRPYEVDRQSAVAIERSIREARPAMLPGDLGRVIAKAMQVEPGGRYATVSEFAADIDRYLMGFPVMAAPRSVWKQAYRFAARHRIGMTAALLTLALAVVAVAMIVRAERQAAARFQQVRRVATGLLFDFEDQVRNLPGSLNARKLVIDRAVEYLAELSRDASADAALAAELADSYNRLARIQKLGGIGSLGDPAGALESLRREEALRRPLADGDVTQAARLLDCYASQASVLDFTGSGGKEGLAVLAKARPLIERHQHQMQTNVVLTSAVADVERWTGTLLLAQAKPVTAREHFEKAVRLREWIHKMKPGDEQQHILLAWAYLNLGQSYAGEGKIEGDMEVGLQWYRRGQAIAESLAAKHPERTDYKYDVAGATMRIGLGLYNMNRAAEAVPYGVETLDRYREIARIDPLDKDVSESILVAWDNLTLFLRSAGKEAEAERQARSALQYAKSLDSKASGWRTQRAVADIHIRLGELLIDRGQPSEAPFRAASRILGKLIEEDPANRRLLTRQGAAYTGLARTLRTVDPAGFRKAVALALDCYRRAEKLDALDPDENADVVWLARQ